MFILSDCSSCIQRFRRLRDVELCEICLLSPARSLIIRSAQAMEKEGVECRRVVESAAVGVGLAADYGSACRYLLTAGTFPQCRHTGI
jgi:hypothetical protein